MLFICKLNVSTILTIKRELVLELIVLWVNEHISGTNISTSRFVLILQGACTDTTRCLYWHYKVLVLILQSVLYGHYKALVVVHKVSYSIANATLLIRWWQSEVYKQLSKIWPVRNVLKQVIRNWIKKYSTQDGVGHSVMNQKACYKHSP